MKIRNRPAANLALRRAGDIDIVRARIDARVNARIQAAKDSATAELAALESERAEITEALREFFLSERTDGRSLHLAFGRIGVRTSSAVTFLRGWTEPRVLAALHAQGLAGYIRIRESLDREAVKANAGVNLLGCGLTIESRETFFCEPDVETRK